MKIMGLMGRFGLGGLAFLIITSVVFTDASAQHMVTHICYNLETQETYPVGVEGAPRQCNRGDIVFRLPFGLSCWDLNGNGRQDIAEDINGDRVWNALDCRGPEGPQGDPGPSISNATFAFCSDGSETDCSQGCGGRDYVLSSGTGNLTCTITSDTGSCTAHAKTSYDYRGTVVTYPGKCCRCAPH